MARSPAVCKRVYGQNRSNCAIKGARLFAGEIAQLRGLIVIMLDSGESGVTLAEVLPKGITIKFWHGGSFDSGLAHRG
jgi:hypothetical protein